MHRIFLTLFALVAASCTTISEKPISPCMVYDWYETGHNDGSRGRPLSEFDAYKYKCERSPNPPDFQFYEAGRNLGLTEYCTPEHGREVGRGHELYQGVCPDFMEMAFLDAKVVGERLADLEYESAKLKRQTELARQDLMKAVSPWQKLQLRTQLSELQLRQSMLLDQIAALNTDKSQN